MVSAISTLLNLILAKLLTKGFSVDDSNAFTKLLLGLVIADTLEMSVVGIPFGINLWLEGKTMLNESMCAFSGGIHFVCDKGSVLILLMLGIIRLRTMRESVPPSKTDVTVRRMLGVTALMLFVLMISSYALMPFPNLKYTYSERYYFCTWSEVGGTGDSWKTLTHEIYWSLGFLAPHLIMTAVIALLAWHCIGYISDPDSCKTQVFLDAVKDSESGQGSRPGSVKRGDLARQPSDEGTNLSIRASRTPNNHRRVTHHTRHGGQAEGDQRASRPGSGKRGDLARQASDEGTTLSIRASRSPNNHRRATHHTHHGIAASQNEERSSIQAARTPNSVRTNFIPPTTKKDEISSKMSSSSLTVRVEQPTSSSVRLSPKPGSKVFDTDMMVERPERKSRVSDESQLRLKVLNRKRFIDGHKTVTFLLLIYTFLNLPRWTALLLEFVLRLGFRRFSNGLLVLMCSTMSTFIRCALTTGVLWWRIINVRHMINEP